jgi:hypothetical protein
MLHWQLLEHKLQDHDVVDESVDVTKSVKFFEFEFL